MTTPGKATRDGIRGRPNQVVDLATVPDLAHYWGWYTGKLLAAEPFRFAPGAIAPPWSSTSGISPAWSSTRPPT